MQDQEAIKAHIILNAQFNYFNETLFGNCKLPADEIILTTEKAHESKRGFFEYGHYATVDELQEYKDKLLALAQAKHQHTAAQQAKVDRFGGRKQRFDATELEAEIKQLRMCRIVMNALYNSRDDRELASTLVHEMVHYWQYKWGARFPKAGGHNQEWADKMVALGLTPVALDKNAKPGQKTGKKCTHEIVDGGAFDRAWQAMPEKLKMPWTAVKFERPEKKTSRKKTYACQCPNNSIYSGKVVSGLYCKNCSSDFVLVDEEDGTPVAPPQPQREEPSDLLMGDRHNPDLDSAFEGPVQEMVSPVVPPRHNPDLDEVFG